MDDLNNTDLRTVVILALSSEDEATAFSKGKLFDILALLGITISKIARDSNLSIDEVLSLINEQESQLERLRKRKKGE